MKFLDFLLKESAAPLGTILFMSSMSGSATALLLATINTAAEVASNRQTDNPIFLIYLVLFIIFVYGQHYAFSKTTRSIEQAIRMMRLRITQKLCFSELRFLEETGHTRIYVRLTQETNLLSESAQALVMASQSVLVAVFSFLYMAWLSLTAFLIAFVVLGGSILLYVSTLEKVSKKLQSASAEEAGFFEMLDHLLKGFKEIKLNRSKRRDIFQRLEVIAEDTEQLKIKVGEHMVIVIIIGQATLYFLLGIFVFILPQFSPTLPDTILKLTATVLFIMGPLGTIINSLSNLTKSSVAVTNIYNLEAQLDAELSNIDQNDTLNSLQQFKHIEFQDIIFHYHNEQGYNVFSVGPVNMKLNRGEIVFIVGGNGSGKSTLLKLLVGLYFPTSGYLYVDDELIDPSNYQQYRELFAIIFTDFHLFDRLYGLTDIDQQHLLALLRLMELEKKTKYIEGKFTQLDLSTGQRKRLALIIALLEDKPIYIFDEWAADQDPVFRKYFYEVLLKDLKKQGKTIIAVTHDDRYFALADRVLKMDYGKLV